MLKTKPSIKPAPCHPERPIYAKGLCQRCYNKHLRDTNPEFAERQRENCRQWTKRHLAEKKQYDRSYRAKQDPGYNRRKALAAYGLTPDDYARMLSLQDGGCAICGRAPKPGKSLAVDHCHQTGRIRGLLCFRCNFGLSFYGECADRMGRAYTYLLYQDDARNRRKVEPWPWESKEWAPSA